MTQPDPDLLTAAEADAIAEAWRYTRRPPGEAHTRRSWQAAQDAATHPLTWWMCERYLPLDVVGRLPIPGNPFKTKDAA